VREQAQGRRVIRPNRPSPNRTSVSRGVNQSGRVVKAPPKPLIGKYFARLQIALIVLHTVKPAPPKLVQEKKKEKPIVKVEG